MPERINIKGISQGVLVSLPEDDSWEALAGPLLEVLHQKANFLKGGQLVIDLRDLAVPADDLAKLQSELQDRDLRLAAILSEDEDTQSAAQALGLATDLASVPPPTPARPNRPAEYTDEETNSEEYGTTGVLIKRTLRSGRTIRSRGHVVVLGDVNSGAEIIAVGDIVVWGKLRGVVHAGAQGDESAVVCALDLAPTQLRIANLITVPPRDKHRQVRPEMAAIHQGQIEALPWEN
jgi:septum site-determining protein MinC